MPLDRRTEAAELFWADEQSVDQQLEAVTSIATRMKFRTRSVVALPLEKKGKYLATLPDISDSIAARVLVNYHLARQRPMMAAFLDSLGIVHENGLIIDEKITKPDAAQLQRATTELMTKFPAADVTLYFATLVSQDPDTWRELAKLLNF